MTKNEFKFYARIGLTEMRPYVPGEDLSEIAVNKEDMPSSGGMIARDPGNHKDQWYVNKKYFKANLTLKRENGTTEGLIVYDVEIKKSIPPKDGKPLIGIEYCKDWNDFDNMGIACICAYRYLDDSYHVFLEDNFGDFGLMLNEAKSIIGYNNWNFDDKLCAANDLVVRKTKSMDLLDAIWKAAGAETPDVQFLKNFGLDNMAFINFGQRKTLDGATAPIQWQRGYRGQVVNYCLSDVKLTKLLIDKVLDDGGLINPLDKESFLRIELKYRENPV